MKKIKKLLLFVMMLTIMLMISGCSIESQNIKLINISISKDMKISATVEISNIDRANFLRNDHHTLSSIGIFYAYTPDKVSALEADTTRVGKNPTPNTIIMPSAEYDGKYTYNVPSDDVAAFKGGTATSFSKELEFDIPEEAKGNQIDFLVILNGIDGDDFGSSNGSASSVLFKKAISYTVTFNVSNGSWDDGTTEAKEVVLIGDAGSELKLQASDIPAVGNKPNSGYTDGAWEPDPAETTITGATTFTYTFTAKQAATATVTKAPTAKKLTCTDAAQALVTAGTAEGGTMQYALGTDATTAPTSGWGTAIPTGTDAGTYYVWYKAVGDADHADSDPKCVEVTIEDDLKDRIVSVNISGGIYRINITQGYATFIKPNSNPGKSFRVLDEAEYSGTKYPVIGIEPEAFKDLKDLETVTLGAKIQEIGQDAFAGSKVKYVHYAGIKAQWKKIKIGMGNDPLKKATRYYKSSGPITKLTLSKTSKTLKVGKTLTLTAKTTPKNAAPKFKWTSSNPNVASVKNGVVKAKKSGKTTITCEALDGSGLKVKCKIKVK